MASCFYAEATGQDSRILIDHALSSPTLTVRYSGAHAALIELRVNGASFGTRTADPSQEKGETDFTLDLAALNNGENDVEVRLYDKGGKLIDSQKTSVSADDGAKAPVYLANPKMGSTVQGPVQINVGFGRELHNTYVSIFIDNQFKSMTNSPPFNYIWDSSRDANGWHEVEAWVVDDASATYKTKKIKVFVNNPGGRTDRRIDPITIPIQVPPAVVAKLPAAAVGAATKAVQSIPKTTAIPAELKASISSVPNVGSSTGIKASAAMSVSTVEKATSAVMPAVSAHVSRTTPIVNAVPAYTSAAAGVKAATLTGAVATGPQMLMPTGKRIAMPPLPATVSRPDVEVASVNTATHTSRPPLSGSIPMLPKVVAVTPKVPTEAVHVATTVAPAKAEPALDIHTVKAATQAATQAQTIVHAAKTASSGLVPINHGVKIPNMPRFSIVMDSKVVKFDNVKPRVENGVPLTPFRYLFEQSGGKVDWHNQSKTVQANGHGREIYIRIGDKLAKVNSLPIEMDLAPFLDHGRTIIPLSFLKDALDITVDYDPVTGHVLITSIKKKH
jgi:hypothetical protein